MEHDANFDGRPIILSMTTKQKNLDEAINERLNYVISMGVLSYSRTQSLQNAFPSRRSTRAAAARPPREAGSDRNRSAVHPQYCHIPTYIRPNLFKTLIGSLQS